MTTYASKTPRDLNRDPYPWVYEAADGNHPRVTERLGKFIAREALTLAGATAYADPRPEFDHVQHNEPNPILVAVRQTPTIAPQAWLSKPLLCGELTMSRYSQSHIEHARRVLERLTNFSQIGA